MSATTRIAASATALVLAGAGLTACNDSDDVTDVTDVTGVTNSVDSGSSSDSVGGSTGSAGTDPLGDSAATGSAGTGSGDSIVDEIGGEVSDGADRMGAQVTP